jgi:hypothetical protein
MTAPVDALLFWHPVRDEPLAADYFEWGPVARGSSADRPFRLRNGSVHYTAEDIVVTMSEFGAPTRSVAAQHFLSTDGWNFSDSINAGSLKPSGTSNTLTLRRVTALDADLGVGDVQLRAEASDWV